MLPHLHRFSAIFIITSKSLVTWNCIQQIYLDGNNGILAIKHHNRTIRVHFLQMYFTSQTFNPDKTWMKTRPDVWNWNSLSYTTFCQCPNIDRRTSYLTLQLRFFPSGSFVLELKTDAGNIWTNLHPKTGPQPHQPVSRTQTDVVPMWNVYKLVKQKLIYIWIISQYSHFWGTTEARVLEVRWSLTV